MLDIIDRKRVESGDPTLGAAIERLIINRCLAQLEVEASGFAISWVRGNSRIPPK